MQSSIKISIGIPAYKGKYLRQAINSVLSQSYPLFELIVVNDASPENLDEIIADFDDVRIKYYINPKNFGAIDVIDNWNKCLSYATGDYFICMGDDDCLLPNCLEDYVHLINKYPNLNVYHAWTEIIDENSDFVDFQTPRPEWECVYSLIWYRLKGRTQFIGDFLFEITALRKNGGFYKLPLAWGSDDITAIIAASQKGVANTQTLCFQYRVNKNTISKTGNVPTKLHSLNLEKEWLYVFLQVKPIDDIGLKYYNLIINEIEKYFDNRIYYTLLQNAKEIISHPFIWHKILKRENISFKTQLKIYKAYILKIILQRG